MKCLAKIALAAFVSFGSSQAIVNFPFPQNSDCDGHATLLSDKEKAAQDLKSQFAYWMKDMYNEQGDIAGVRSNPGSNEYFSEGVGYGMLLMVYFSDNTTSYQSQFDKIWNLYKKFMNSNGLMHWKLDQMSSITGSGAALDGDIDAAAALIMAYYQFGDEKYKDDAKTLIQNMKKYEFEDNGLHLPGDSWGDAAFNRKNPGYFDPAYMPLFAAIDEENADFWKNKAYDANMKLYEASSKEVSTGLIDDWTNKDGKSEDDMYSYDASRAPWRNAKAVCWHGDERALAIDKKMAEFVSRVNAEDMKGPVIRSSGNLGNDHNSTFVTSLMTSLISDAKYQSKLDEYWNEAVSLGDENYFNQSLKLLNGLLVSGNMPNLMTAGNKVPESSSSSTTSSSSSYLTSSSFTPNSSSNPEGVVSSSSIDIFPRSSNSDAISPVGMKPTQFFVLNGENLSLNFVGDVRVDLFSVNGNVIKTLWNGKVNGSRNVSLEGVPSGIYVVRLNALNVSQQQVIRVR